MSACRPVTRTRRCGATFALVLFLWLAAPPERLVAQRPAEALDPAIASEFAAAQADPEDFADELGRRATLRHGSIDLLLGLVEEVRADESVAPERRRFATRVAVRLLRVRGDLGEARERLESIPVELETAADCLAKAEVHDALGRDDEALAAYDRLLLRDIDETLENRIRMRVALMRKSAGERSSLAAFAAAEGRDPAIRNQAALILALQGQPKDAIELYSVTGSGVALYREEIRLAEWAIDASLWDRAQDFAWRALRTATQRRDRRYALTILVEAYRRDRALDELVERFGAETDLDPEARQTWIDLLRETGRVDEALTLFRSSTADGAFTVEMRRELLEMCRETGREDTLVAAYRKLMAEEPRFLEWREGLARYYLERGDRPAASALWEPFLATTTEPRRLMSAAATLMGLGLDDLAERFARRSIAGREGEGGDALLFLFELAKDRGRSEAARAVLDELDRSVPADAAVRKDLADAYARLGDKVRGVEVLEALAKALGAQKSPDLDMKLALLLSEVDREDDALERWLALWREIDSIPRRRYVEDRIMTVASRLGSLARIAVDIERKLVLGEADDREAGLLVRLYTRVNDPVSATEVIEEHMTRRGGSRADVLAEKARVFLTCQDYYNYEKAIEELMVVDVEGRPDHLRQLAMSKLERGQRDQAKQILDELKDVEVDATSDEFEAGVLALAGMREEALVAYRRGLARHSERIDTYLLLSNVQRELGRHDRSAGMFQDLALTAEKDDLFTIAIDGILNMRDGRANRGAPDRLVEWARRVALERLARSPDKLYLHQLVVDLSEELKDRATAIRTMKAALPIAGEQRTSLLRELMAMAKPTDDRFPPGVIFFGAALSPRGFQSNTDQLMFGRRLLGQGELVPPQVYLDLGDAFLNAGEVTNAAQTFNQASRLPEFAELQRKIAASFEKARYPEEALRVYERILSVESSDVGLLLKVAELQEQLGRDDRAAELYRRGLELSLARRPFSTTATVRESKDEEQALLYRGGNVEADEEHFDWLVRGLLATVAEGAAIDEVLDELATRAGADLGRRRDETVETAALSAHPRLVRTTDTLRRLALGYGLPDRADRVDRDLLAAFPKDAELLGKLVRARLDRGFVAVARRLVEATDRPAAEKERLLLLTGAPREELPGAISVAEAAGLILPLIVEEKNAAVKALLERLDLSTGEEADLEVVPVLVSTAAYLGDSELALTLCRHWLGLAVEKKSGELYQQADQLLSRAAVALDQDQQRSLVESLIARVVDEPDKFSIFISRLPELQRNVGGRLLTTEQAEQLIKKRLSGADEFIYGIPQLFALVPPADRSSVFRRTWSLVPKSQRALFILMLVPGLDQPIDDGFADALVASFEAAVGDVDDDRTLTYYVDELVDSGEHARGVSLRVLQNLRQRSPGQPLYGAALALLLAETGRWDEALAMVGEAYGQFLAAPTTDYYVRRSVESIHRIFGPEHRDALVAAIDAWEEKNGAKPTAAGRRVDLIELDGDAAATLAALRAAVESHPSDVPLRTRLRSSLRSVGRGAEAAETDAAIVAIEPTKDEHRKRLVTAWRALRHAPNALAARAESQDEEAGGPASERKPRTPIASVARIKDAVAADDSETARRLVRRLWRVFPDRSDRYYTYNYEYQASMRRFWPEAEKERKRARGGLPEVLDETDEELHDRRAERGDQRTLADALVDRDFGAVEIRRQLRSFDDAMLDGELASDVLRALARADATRLGAEPALDQLLAIERAGRAGKVEYGLLFALLETSEDGEAVADTLAGLIVNLEAADAAQIRRMARLYARRGDTHRASLLYRWCATRLEGGFGYYGGADELLDEVVDNLAGEERDLAVAAILTWSDPGTRYPWARDGYERLVLDTWVRLLGPEAALARARDLCESAATVGQSPRRATAARAAALWARSGDVDRAIACLEVAVCRLEPPGQLEYPWLRDEFLGGGALGPDDLRRLFPPDLATWSSPEVWLRRVSDQLEEWRAAKRIDAALAFDARLVIALRLHEIGAAEAAAELLTAVRPLVRGDARRELWVADVLRRTGREEQAHRLEVRLLGDRSLEVERVPEVVQRVLERDGGEAGLALAEGALTWTRHPDLLALLPPAAEALGRMDDAERFRAMIREADAADAALEASDSSPD